MSSTDDPSRPVVEFDHHSVEHARDPFASFDEINAHGGLAFTLNHGGYWIATNYDDVLRIASDLARFTSAPRDGVTSTQIPGKPALFQQPPLHMDPPQFIHFRRLLEREMTSTAAQAMEPGIQYWADYLLDQVIETGELDVTSDFAIPLTSTVVADWLGLPVTDSAFYAERFELLQHASPGSEVEEAAYRGMREIADVLFKEIGDRRASPRDDLLSVIAHATVDGEPIDPSLALGAAFLVLSGGITTTAVLTSHAVIGLADDRSAMKRILEDDSFLKTATEELIRIASPVLSTARRATDDVPVGDHTIKCGERVLLAWGAANRSDEKFSCPHQVDLERWPNRHMGFGAGGHRCVGAELGRLMFTVMIRTLLRRAGDYKLMEVKPSENRPLDNSFSAIRIEFTPGQRVLGDRPPVRQF